MEQYTSRTAIINLGGAPVVPTFRWPLDARLDMSRRQCAAPVKHQGRARRFRREVRTRQALAFLAGAPSARVPLVSGDGRQLTIGELLHAPIPNAPSWALALRMQGRALLDLVTRHGPASGWGIAQPPAGAAHNPKWTPYYVPKASERCWRWWRAAFTFLLRVLSTLARAWWRLVPLHRTAPGGTTAGETGGVLRSPSLVEPPGCRDQSPLSLRALLDRIGSRFAM